MFDKNDKGIDATELMDVMNHLLKKKNEGTDLEMQDQICVEDAMALIKYYDHDEDNVLDFAEFAKILMEKDAPKKEKTGDNKFTNRLSPKSTSSK